MIHKYGWVCGGACSMSPIHMYMCMYCLFASMIRQWGGSIWRWGPNYSPPDTEVCHSQIKGKTKLWFLWYKCEAVGENMAEIIYVFQEGVCSSSITWALVQRNGIFLFDLKCTVKLVLCTSTHSHVWLFITCSMMFSGQCLMTLLLTMLRLSGVWEVGQSA